MSGCALFSVEKNVETLSFAVLKTISAFGVGRTAVMISEKIDKKLVPFADQLQQLK